MDGSSQGLGRSDDLRIWSFSKFAAAQNTDICDLDLEPKDQDGVGGTTRGDQDVDLQNGSELVVVQETWHIRMVSSTHYCCDPDMYGTSGTNGAKEEQAPV